MARVYVCYESGDIKHRNDFAGMMQNQNNQIIDFPVIDKVNMRPEGPEAVKRYILSLMRDCAAVAVLIGRNTHNAPVVQWELEVANSQRKGFLAVRIPNKQGGLPPLLKRLNIQELDWDPDQIEQELSRLFGR